MITNNKPSRSGKVGFLNRFSLQDGSLLQFKKTDCHPTSDKVF